jgi:putative membrane protein
MSDNKEALAESRTDLAEDRTLLANERTFAGWMRTGLTAIGVGVGFHALFPSLEPVWIAKALATLFILIGIFIFWAADKRACDVHGRLDEHKVETADGTNMRLIACALSAGALGLVAAIWALV